jgi:carbamoyltransferase
MKILGVNCAYHDSAACIVVDRTIVAAAEEERFTRRKHAKIARLDNPDEIPLHAIRFCLEEAGIEPGQIDHIGYSLDPERRRRNADFVDRVVEGSWGSRSGEEQFYRHVQRVPEALRALGLTGRFHWLAHHLCHAASAFYCSPFAEAGMLTLDGIGETTSTVLALAGPGGIRPWKEIEYPASIGFLWERFAKFLGFGEYDACKIMSLGAFGDATAFRPLLDRLAWPLRDGSFAMDGSLLCFRVEDYAPLENLLGMRRRKLHEPLEGRHMDLAAALQEKTDELVLALARALHGVSPSENLCLAGGVALNCLSNRKLLEEGPFRNLFVQPAANDAGTALGAALALSAQLGEARVAGLESCCLGPEYSAQAIQAALQRRGASYKRVDSIEWEAARLIAAGAVVAWFQGRMEFGPRALGSRSLLADPRDPATAQDLNLRIKHRESFRPFAASVLDEEAEEWFEIQRRSAASDFMLIAYPARAEVRERVPAVLHVDGTSRIQTVRRSASPRYHRLISCFRDLTGVPMLLNTSFNDSEPIACTPDDALDTFQKTQIDHLAIGDFMVSR